MFVVSASNPEISIRECFRGVMPFFLMELFIVGLLIAFPSITLFAVVTY